MSNFKTKILEILTEIKGSGSFLSRHTSSFQYPGLEVEDFGEIAFPINEAQAKALIKKAHKAPFGKGSETIVDSKVRSGWEIDAADMNFTGDGWDAFLTKVVDKIKPDLGIEEYEISASLYKMLIYEEGDFFLPHKDSEKEKGMFGTLIIGLPGHYSGGELLVRFDGKEKVVDFAKDADNFKMPYTAFYADCEHEIKPLTSGYRVCLVYNLIQQKAAKQIQIEPLEKQVKQLVDLLEKEKADPDTSVKIILPGHQYTPENFSMEALKLDDRSKVEALIRAADRAGYYSKMALVTSYVMGLPEYEYYDREVDENAEMEEVYDEDLSVEHWMAGGVPLLTIKFEEDDLIAAFKLNEDEPIVKESEGYMGNYGPELMYYYHYGAMLLWPKEIHASLLLNENTKSKLAWIDYYNKMEQLDEAEKIAAETILASDLDSSGREKIDYTPLVEWLIKKDDKLYFAEKGTHILQQNFVNMDAKQLAQLAGTYPKAFAETLSDLMSRQAEIAVFDHFLFLLKSMSANQNPDLGDWVATQIQNLPRNLAKIIEGENREKPIVKKETWSNILSLEKMAPQDEVWVQEMADLITACRQRKYINAVLVAEVLPRKESTPLAEAVLKICQQDLQQRVNDKPQPPKNWSRALPDTIGNKQQWAILASFLQSPDEQVFDFARRQNERTAMEYAIKGVTIDLKMETIRKGSPHTLRITKTQAEFFRNMKKWHEDVALLQNVNEKMEESQ